MKYAFIAQKLSDYPLSVTCETLDISPAGSHAWRTRPQAYRTLQNQELSRKIKEIFLASGKTYGARRIVAELRELHGYTGSLNRIKRLMGLAGLRSKARRKFKATTDWNHKLPIAPNLLEQKFLVEQPNRVLLSNIIYIWTKVGWLYLCCVLDLFNREIVGWSMKEKMTQDIVLDALQMAKLRRRLPSGAILHSDRGSQYASRTTQNWLKAEKCSNPCQEQAIATTMHQWKASGIP